MRSRGDADASVELFWQAFETAPSLTAYRRLLDEAPEERDQWRRRCIDVLRDRTAAQVGEAQRFRTRPSDALVDVLMFEGQVDAAWEVARDHGCDRRKLMALARSRETDHPLDAIDVYETEVFSLVEQKKNHTYKAAVDLMARIEVLATGAGDSARFDNVLARARTEHRAKRNLKKLLDARRWPDPRTKP